MILACLLNPTIPTYFFYPFFDVGLVSEKKKFLSVGELELEHSGVKNEV